MFFRPKDDEKVVNALKTRIENEGLCVYETDKTGKLVIDTLDNYEAKMQKHMAGDTFVTEKEVRSIEAKLNTETNS